MSPANKKQQGQALTEYVLLTALVVGLLSLVSAAMPRLLGRLEEPLRQRYKYAYKYGDPEACGFDDTDPPCTGSPRRHPRYYLPENFRMFGRK